MSDDQMEEIEIDENHPWVIASTVMKPQPIMANVSVDAVQFTFGEGEEPTRAAMLSIVDPTGVKNIFLPPEILDYLMAQCGAVRQQWAREDMTRPKLVVADKNMERSVVAEQKIHQQAREGKNPFQK